MDFGFPPFGAQWERGPSGFLKDGVGAIPHQMHLDGPNLCFRRDAKEDQIFVSFLVEVSVMKMQELRFRI